MEPVKFEEQARKQLQNRDITPSAGSWEKLEQRLETQQDKKGFNLWWIGAVAAIAVVFFFLGTLFGDQSVVQQTPAVVATPSETVEEQVQLPEEQNLIPQKVENRVASEAAASKEDIPAQQHQQKTLEKALALQVEDRKENMASEEVEKNTFLEPHEMLAQTSEEKKSPSEVTNSEVDALLMLASAKIEADPAYAQSTVNAKDLLNEVEFELEESFRDKVFEVIKVGLVKAKTAVANRSF